MWNDQSSSKNGGRSENSRGGRAGEGMRGGSGSLDLKGLNLPGWKFGVY